MWDKITVGKFQQLFDIQRGHFDIELEKYVQLLACLDDKPVEHYEQMPVPELMKHVPRLAFLSTGDIPKVTVPREAQIGNRKYRFLYDFRDLCAGQFIDVQSVGTNPEDQVMNLNRLLAAICVPMDGKKILKYGDVPFDEVADDMLELPVLQAISISAFFLNAWSSFLKVIPGYLEKKAKKGKKWTEMEHRMYILASLSAGDGSAMPIA